MTIPGRASSGTIVRDATQCKNWPNISSIYLEDRMGLGEEAASRSMLRKDPGPIGDGRADTVLMRGLKSVVRPSISQIRLAIPLLTIVASFATLPITVRSQSLAASGEPSVVAASTLTAKFDLNYTRPTQKTKLRNYVFDAYGPYPIFGAALAGGIGQLNNSPPEWGQGAQGFGKRMGSDFGIAATGTTVRYGLAEAFKEDTLYYRCACSGVLPRLAHAALSTLTARRGEDGHRVFSVPALLAPYAGSFTAVYGWYPNRFGAKDAFRMGNYTLLANLGGNIALEFVYSGPHSLLSRMHLNDTHAAPSNEAKIALANDTHAAPVEGPNH